MQWQIGTVKVTRIVELEMAGGTRFILPQATPEAVKPMQWMVPHFATEDGKLIMSVHALVIETPERLMLVDTCIGNDKVRSIPTWNLRHGPFLEELAKAGYVPEQFDTIMCTHLHVDHVGWNTRLVEGVWVPTFPNARYLIGEQEFRYWSQVDPATLNEDIMSDSIQPVLDAGLVDLVASDHRVSEEVRFESTPGHTPGHVSIRIQSEGKQALITGECIHHPCQIEQLDWSSSADFDSDTAAETRKRLLAEHNESSTLIIGTHFATPSAGYIRTKEDAYYLDVSADHV